MTAYFPGLVHTFQLKVVALNYKKHPIREEEKNHTNKELALKNVTQFYLGILIKARLKSCFSVSFVKTTTCSYIFYFGYTGRKMSLKMPKGVIRIRK